MNKRSGNLLLLGAAMIWGGAFVAQRRGMDFIGPFTFQGVRSLLGSAVLLLVLILRRAFSHKRQAANWRALLKGGLLCGVVLAAAGSLQQVALTETSAGKAGFLTSLYILIVPLISCLRGKAFSPMMWLPVGLAVAGLYLLSVKEGLMVTRADLLLIGCAFLFAVHILLVDHFSPQLSGLALSCAQFFVAGVLSILLMAAFETPRLGHIINAWGPIAYAGILSSAVAYTLQILGQRKTAPAVASLIMSLESVFAVLSGALLLGERLSRREIAGCAIMFIAILLAQYLQLPRTARPGVDA